MIRKILVAYDGSDNARRALEVACELSNKLEAELSIVHVLMHGRPARELVRMAEIEHLVERSLDDPAPSANLSSRRPLDLPNVTGGDAQSPRVITAIGDQLIALAKNSSAELGVQNIKTFLRAGDYAEEIVAVAKEQDVDMIVIGSRGLGKIREAVLGSVSQKVLHHASQTVTTVK